MTKYTFAIFPKPDMSGTVITMQDGMIQSSTQFTHLPGLLTILEELKERKYVASNDATAAFAVLASKAVEPLAS